MKKMFLAVFILSGCATAPETATPSVTAQAAPGTGTATAPAVAPEKPLEPQAGETRQAFLERQIAELTAQIVKLEPTVTAARNRVDPAGEIETKNLNEKLFALERKKASLELQLLSLPEEN